MSKIPLQIDDGLLCEKDKTEHLFSLLKYVLLPLLITVILIEEILVGGIVALNGLDNVQTGIRKPEEMKNPQAHHDLPEKFQKEFNAVGLDIDAAEYGRWVKGSEQGVENVGTHQNWSYDFNQEWEKFLNREGIPPTKEEILQKMNELRNDPRFQ
jgi:hypothetical protein